MGTGYVEIHEVSAVGFMQVVVAFGEGGMGGRYYGREDGVASVGEGGRHPGG